MVLFGSGVRLRVRVYLIQRFGFLEDTIFCLKKKKIMIESFSKKLRLTDKLLKSERFGFVWLEVK